MTNDSSFNSFPMLDINNSSNVLIQQFFLLYKQVFYHLPTGNSTCASMCCSLKLISGQSYFKLIGLFNCFSLVQIYDHNKERKNKSN